MLENVLQLFKYLPEFNTALGAGILIFARFMGFIIYAPILNRKDIPFMAKLSFSILMTLVFISILSPEAPPPGTSLFLSIILNLVFGGLIGYIAGVVFATITAAGDMINMQMGLSSSVMFDPSSREQISPMGKFFNFFATVIFINIGGLYWLFSAFERGFSVFPLYNTTIPMAQVVDINYLVTLTGNVLFVGLQLAAPVLVATLAMDMILGIISKTAPQVNVFQLSFLFKPLLGVTIMVIILPILLGVVSDYFLQFSNIY